jgi:hypothetical protein
MKKGVMPTASGHVLWMNALFAERDTQRRRDREAADHLRQHKEEVLVELGIA